MRRVFVDTSGWYELAVAENPVHLQVAAALRVPDTKFVTSTFVLHELVALLVSRRRYAMAAQTVAGIRSAPEVRMEHPDAVEEAAAWRLFLDRPGKCYTLTDCLSFVIMRRLGISEAITFDSHFGQEGFTILP